MCKSWRFENVELYDVAIDELSLSDVATVGMLRMGVTTIGDCLDFFERIPDVLMPIHGKTWDAIKEVEQMLIKKDYMPKDWLEINTSESEKYLDLNHDTN